MMQKNLLKTNFSRMFIVFLACISLLLMYLYFRNFETAGADVVSTLYPDLKTLAPRDLRFDRTDVSLDNTGVMHNVLRFSNTVYNIGAGRVEIRAVIDQNTQNGAAYQRVYNTDDTYTDYLVGNLYYHAQHAHYHFENWGEYQLWTKADYDDFIASGGQNDQLFQKVGTKTTSCIVDEEFVARLFNTTFPGMPGLCQPNEQHQIIETLSSGWGDTYDYDLYEQWIDLDQATLPDGDYVLRSVTDMQNIIYESDNKEDSATESPADNEAITPFTIAGGVILDSTAPSGTIYFNSADMSTVVPIIKVNVLGRDDVSGVDQVSLSNDGINWKTYIYTGVQSDYQPIIWNLTNATYGGNAQKGLKTVYARFRDQSGKFSEIISSTIYLDLPNSAYSVAVLGDAPVSYWRLSEFSGTLTADQKFTNNGTYMNGPKLGAAGLISSDAQGKAVVFDGVNDFVAVTNTSSFAIPSTITLEAWIKPNSIPVDGVFRSIVTKPDTYSLQFHGPAVEFAFKDSNASWQRVAGAPNALTAGQVYHIVGTYDGFTQKLYVNGVEVASTLITATIATGTSNLSIGSWDGSSEFFAGTIDDVAVYNHVLSAVTVKSHYDIQAGIIYTATPSATVTQTQLPTFTHTVTQTFTKTPTKTATRTGSPAKTATPTITKTRTITKTATRTGSPTKTVSPTITKTRTVTKTATKTATPITVTFTSLGAQDGWIFETSQSSNNGGTANNVGTTISLGDDNFNRQYLGVFSFSTGAGIPDTATVTGVILKVKRESVAGTGDPLSIFQGFMIDVKNGFFGTADTLQIVDFDAAASGTYGPGMPAPVSNVYSLNLAGSKANINKLTSNNGLTQIRLRFKLADNGDALANTLNLYSGDATLATDRPQLVISYIP